MPKIHSGAVAAVLAALVLTGCASVPKAVVESNGAIPARSGYAFVANPPENVRRSVSEMLARRGLTESASPAYLVQITYAQRPAGTGLLVPAGETRQWLQSPDLLHKKRLVATLGISMSEAASGRQLYSALASERLRAKGDAWTSLLHAILPGPAAEAAPD